MTENPPESAVDLFRALKRLIAERRLMLRPDYKRLQHIDCPVGSEADGNVWAYAILAAALLAFWFGGWRWAAGIGVAGIMIYMTAGQAYVRRRIRRRIEQRALESLDLWQRLWRFGGIALVPPGQAPCKAPKGNWMALVRRTRGEPT